METKQTDPRSLQVHPLNEALIPPMRVDEFEALKASIEEHGIKHPLQVLKGTHLVIDGRNRLKAALELGLSKVPIVELELSPQTLALYILRTTSEHRHLSTGQKAALAAEYVCAKIGTDNTSTIESSIGAKIGTDNTLSLREVREEAARYLAVSHTYVQVALNLKRYAPESFELLKRGEITLQEAQGILTRARIEKEAADRLIPELLELIDRADLDPAVVWEICFMSEEGQRWLVRTIEQAGLDVAQEFAELTPRDMKEVRLTVEEIINHPAVQKELETKEEKIEELQRKIEKYREKQQEIENKLVSLEEEKEMLLDRIHELEERPQVSHVEEQERQELQERLEEMKRKIEDLELECGRLELDRDSAQREFEKTAREYQKLKAEVEELRAKVKEQEEYIVRLKEAFRKKKKRKSWVDEIKAQHKREIDKYERKLEKQREKTEEIREGIIILTKILTKKEQVKKRKELVRDLYEIAGHLKAEDLHQRLFDAVVDPYTEKNSIFSAFSQVVEGLEALTETFSKACKVALQYKKPGGDKEGGEDEASSAKIVRIEEARAAAGGRDVSET